MSTLSIAKGAMPVGEILSGLESHDRALHVKDGWIRDPYITLGGDGFYYLTGTTPNPGDPREKTEPYNTGLDHPDITGHSEPSIVGTSVRLWRSENLAEWEDMGVVFTMDKGYWAEADRAAFDNVPQRDWRLWAPEAHFINGDWIIVHTSPAPVKGGANFAVFKGEGFMGPIEHPMEAVMKRRHDPSIFQDDDGTAYLLWGNTWIAPLKDGYRGFAKEPIRIDPQDRRIGHEGATLRKIGDKYVHFGTAWSTDKMRKGTYNMYYCEADHPLGPYGPRKFAGRFLGHGTPFIDKKGQWWCTAFFNANVPPISRDAALRPSVGDDANTINEQGTTIVPLEVRVVENGEIFIRAKDPAYRNPGPEEAEKYERF